MDQQVSIREISENVGEVGPIQKRADLLFEKYPNAPTFSVLNSSTDHDLKIRLGVFVVDGIKVIIHQTRDIISRDVDTIFAWQEGEFVGGAVMETKMLGREALITNIPDSLKSDARGTNFLLSAVNHLSGRSEETKANRNNGIGIKPTDLNILNELSDVKYDPNGTNAFVSLMT